MRIRTPEWLDQGRWVLPLLALAAISTAGCQPPIPAGEIIRLETGWEFKRTDAAFGPHVPQNLRDTLRAWLPAGVPGTVHTDLLANGLIPDPFWRDSELSLQWIGEEDWSYRTTFPVPARFLEHELIELVFHGLDTFAEVRLNDGVILEADNMFRRWTSEVKSHLRPGAEHPGNPLSLPHPHGPGSQGGVTL